MCIDCKILKNWTSTTSNMFLKWNSLVLRCSNAAKIADGVANSIDATQFSSIPVLEIYNISHFKT